MQPHRLQTIETIMATQFFASQTKMLEYILNQLVADKDFNFIARDEDSGLYLFESEPHKESDRWYNCCFESFSPYNNLFKDIKWEDNKPIYIDDYVER